MRFDRLITLKLVQPVRRTFNSVSTLGKGPGREGYFRNSDFGLQILMYHSISDLNEDNISPYYRVCTKPKVFAEQMQWLADNGYEAVTLSEALSLLQAEKSESKTITASKRDKGRNTRKLKPVILTFDDGFRDFYSRAFPVLHKHGFSATVFLPTAYIGGGDSIKPRDESYGVEKGNFSSMCRLFKGIECLTWSEVIELHSGGIEFGSHTVNHPKLVELSWKEIEAEIRQSKLEIEARIGAPCLAFAYPYAFPSADTMFVKQFGQILIRAGYRCGVTTGVGRIRHGDDPYSLKRLPVNTCDDRALFAAKLAGAYDWIGLPQRITKKFKRSKRN